jgi:RNA-directed DNA polymerase
VKGTREQAQTLLDRLAWRVEALGLSLKSEKTAVTHIDEGFVFLGQRIVRRPKGPKRHVYTFVSDEALASARRKVKALTGRSTINLELSELIAALNPVLRGWGNYFRHAAAKRTLVYLGYYAWWRVGRWLRKKHPRMTWKQIQRRYASEGTFPDLPRFGGHVGLGQLLLDLDRYAFSWFCSYSAGESMPRVEWRRSRL